MFTYAEQPRNHVFLTSAPIQSPVEARRAKRTREAPMQGFDVLEQQREAAA